jgi:hypothetical protein
LCAMVAVILTNRLKGKASAYRPELDVAAT